MDTNQRVAGPLLDRANANIVQLLRRFENIIAYNTEERNDQLSAAVAAYQMEVETAALIKAAEDILSLTRTLKETWLFGKLQPMGTSEAEEKTEMAMRKVVENVAKLERSNGTVVSEGEEGGNGDGDGDVEVGGGSGGGDGGDVRME